MGAELGERGNGGWTWCAMTAFLHNLILFSYEYMLLLINNKQIQMFKSKRSVTAFSALLWHAFLLFYVTLAEKQALRLDTSGGKNGPLIKAEHLYQVA